MYDRGAGFKSTAFQRQSTGKAGKGRPPRRLSAAWRKEAGPPENIRRTVTPAVERCHDLWDLPVLILKS